MPLLGVAVFPSDVLGQGGEISTCWVPPALAGRCYPRLANHFPLHLGVVPGASVVVALVGLPCCVEQVDDVAVIL